MFLFLLGLSLFLFNVSLTHQFHQACGFYCENFPSAVIFKTCINITYVYVNCN